MVDFRIERNGLALRFGQPDTPAPQGEVPADESPKIVVALGPLAVRARVGLRLRLPGGERMVRMEPAQRTRTEQFFEAAIPDLRPGMRVLYSIVVDASSISSRNIRLDSADAANGQVAVSVKDATPPPEPLPSASPTTARVTGIIALENGLPAVDMRLRLYSKGFGGARTLVGETRTSADGAYEVANAAGQGSNVELFAIAADGREIQLSGTKFDAQAEENIDLFAPSSLQAGVCEFTRLQQEVTPHAGGDFASLRNAMEVGQRRDFSYLANASGWDAGAIALASEALEAEARTGIPAEGAYALARAGLPTEPGTLAYVAKSSVANALRQAAAAGVIDAAAVEASAKAFNKFAGRYRLGNAIPGTVSSANEFIAKARISEPDRAAFAAVVEEDMTGDVWKRAREAGVSEAGVQSLQLQGKLAYLTFNNADLVAFLEPQVGTEVNALIGLGYHAEQKWIDTLKQLAGGDGEKLAAMTPPAFTGTIEERVAEYAEEMARRVRQIDPHAVTIERVAAGELARVENPQAVGAFLRNAATQGFRLGKTPFSSFLRSSSDAVWAGVDAALREPVIEQARTLTALYSVSPDDEALGALMQAGFTSATGIARWDKSVLAKELSRYYVPRHRFGETDPVNEIYWRAQQQAATVFNVFDGLKRLRSPFGAPGAASRDAKLREDQIVSTRKKLAGLFPTIETLFGSADYCACDQCQSVLSPAAYLVDLLHFIDPNEEAWASIKASYEARTGFPYAKSKPFDALNRRRPDIKNLALTCENTNTALPYIDVVNEILEQLMMSDQTPPAIEAYDVGDTPSADLVVEPQNTLWSAYVGAPGKKGLKDLIYPLSLPFDLPLETVRQYLKHLEIPLWKLRETVAAPKTLEATAPGRTDGWTDVWFERLGLSPNDVTALTRAQDWHELFGYASKAEALKIDVDGKPGESSLRNAKTLARRLAVTYGDLAELLRTRFVNPDIENLIALKRLQIDPERLDRYFGVGPALDAKGRTELEADVKAQGVEIDELEPLRAEDIRKRTLVLRSPSVSCDFSNTWLEFDGDRDAADEATSLVLLKLNAFERLLKKIGWGIHELDRALMALMPHVSSLTEAALPGAMKTALIYLAHVEELRDLFGDRISREDILTFWTDIPTTGVSCLYERLFLGSAALGRDAAFDKRLGKVLTDPAATIDAHADAIREALRLEAADIGPILDAAGAADRQLSIENLSTLMRHSRLAAGLDLSVSDLLTVMSLSDHKPFASLHDDSIDDLGGDVAWTRTVAFVKEARLLARAGVDAAFLNRMCRNVGMEEEPKAAADPVLLALNALDPTESVDIAQRSKLIIRTLAAQLSVSSSLVDKLVSNVLKDAEGAPLVETGFANPETSAESVRKLRKALDLLLSLGVGEAELAHILSVPGGIDLSALPLTAGVSEASARAVRRGLGVWLSHVAARNELGPAERVLDVITAVSQPIDVANTFEMRQDRFVVALRALTGAKPEALAAFLAAIGAVAAPGAVFAIPQLRDASGIARVVDAFRCAYRTRLAPAEVVQLASVAMDQSVAQKLRSSLKSRYARSAWRRVAKQIFDVLRQKQRDALVAYLTNVKEGDRYVYGDTMEKLFEHLLIDPGMQSVVLASRIQLAIASVQLFIHRCLRNEESDEVGPEIIDKARWEWMQRYRVWEVNRKFFVWPENWLDPEFRDDKTHLFRALESKLLQVDVDEDLVRNVMHEYLRGLEEIARLEILTMYFEPGTSADGSAVHIVGRTQNAPYKYFHRRMSHGMWTPWEPIDIGVEGRHLVLTKWRDRIHLFWVSFLEDTQQNSRIPETFSPSTDSVKKADIEGKTVVKLQLHWAEQVAGAWINRSSTPGFVDTNFADCRATSDEQKAAFFVRAVEIENEFGAADDDLEIQISNATAAAHTFLFFSKLAPPRSKNSDAKPPEPPFVVDEGGSATKWKGSGALYARFVSKITQNSASGALLDSGEHRVLGGGEDFTLLFPSNEQLPIPARTPPVGVGRPTGFVFGPQGTKHVAYRSSDGGIHDLFGTKIGWFHQSPSDDAQFTDQAGDIEPAEGDPCGYSLDGRGMVALAYAGKTRVHELIWSQLDSNLVDSALMATGWRCETLYQAPSEAERPLGRVVGGVFAPDRGVVFRTRDGLIRAAAETSDGAWQATVLNAGRPIAASDPCGAVMSTPGSGAVTSRHLFYRGVDGHIHELRSDGAGVSWTYTNLTQTVPGAAAPAPDASPGAYPFLNQNTVHVVYRGADGRIHELWGAPGAWAYNATGAPFTEAKGDPTGYVTESYNTQHIVYRGKNDEVVELWWNGVWRENILSQTSENALPAGNDIAGYSFETERTQHVIYFSADGKPCELAWSPRGWRADRYELHDPFPDNLGPLAAPFFYEATGRDHTFFVEPYVIETTAHEWKSWVVTTKEYVPDYIKRFEFIPLIPQPALVAPSDIGIFKRPLDLKSRPDEKVLLRTSKGLIETRKQTIGLAERTPAAVSSTVSLADTRRGAAAASLVARNIPVRGGR